MTYQFTSNQLTKLLGWTISSYQEHIDQHGKDEETAAACAIREVIDGMTAERELIEDGVKLEPSHTTVGDMRAYIADRLDYLARLTYHHECNIAQPDADEQYAYYEALGEQRALQAVQRVMEGGKP